MSFNRLCIILVAGSVILHDVLSSVCLESILLISYLCCLDCFLSHLSLIHSTQTLSFCHQRRGSNHLMREKDQKGEREEKSKTSMKQIFYLSFKIIRFISSFLLYAICSGFVVVVFQQGSGTIGRFFFSCPSGILNVHVVGYVTYTQIYQ